MLGFSENRINNDPGVQTILNEISNIRKALNQLQHYDTISVPLVYTQVGFETIQNNDIT